MEKNVTKRVPKMGHGPGGNTGAGEKAKDFKGTLAKLGKRYLTKYKWQLVLVFIFAVASTIFAIVGPKVLGKATTELFNGVMRKITGNGGIDFGIIARIIGTLLILYGVSCVFSVVQGLIMTSVSQKLTYKMRDDLSKKIHKLPMNFFDKKNKGEVLSILTNDIDTFGQSFNQSITQVITAVCTVVRNFNNDVFYKCYNNTCIASYITNFSVFIKNNCWEISEIF